MRITPPPSQDIQIQEVTDVKKTRNSNLELYRIICMIMIVAHHYVVNSGLTGTAGPLYSCAFSSKGVFLWLLGMWGKTGINCFMMITGYFMCISKITARKFVKLLAQIYFYNILIYVLFLISGYETLSGLRIVKLLIPFWGFGGDFIGCFIVFYLTIPFWTILVKNMNKRQHGLLLLLLLGCYTLLGSIPTFRVSFNYITWFGIIFLTASYIRLYPMKIFECKSLWGWLSIFLITIAMASVVILNRILNAGYFLVTDCNKFFAVLIAVSTFLWFKNINIRYNQVINAIGAATFGVLLIHANSNAMRTWLWKDAVDVVGHYGLPLGKLVLFSIGVVLAIFLVCNLIDQLRIATLEKWFFNWYDSKISAKADKFVNRLIGK